MHENDGLKGRLVLPSDLIVYAVADLPEDVRSQISFEAGDFAITRKHIRSPSKIVTARMARLLEHFRTPSTIVGAVLQSLEPHEDPHAVMIEALPFLNRLFHANLLAVAGSPEADPIVPLLDLDRRVADMQIVECIQLLEDAEVYRVRDAAGRPAALKVTRTEGRSSAATALDREATILRKIHSNVCPALIAEGTIDGRPYLLLEWIEGKTVDIVARDLRWQDNHAAHRQLISLATKILSAYAYLHDQGTVHGDVHPRNVIVEPDGGVRLIDFGHACDDSLAAEQDPVGLEFYMAPEEAIARLAGRSPPVANTRSEQYALAAMLFMLLTGGHHAHFTTAREDILREIAKGGRATFAERGRMTRPETESALNRALSNAPCDRFNSIADFAAALSASCRDAVDDGGRQSLHQAMLERILLDQEVLPRSAVFAGGPLCSVNMGAAGVAYALYRIASVRQDARLICRADLWCSFAESQISDEQAFFIPQIELTPKTVGVISPFHCAPGVHCVRVLIAQALGDFDGINKAVSGFIRHSIAHIETSELDLTIGVSGTLLACSLLLPAIPTTDLCPTGPLRSFGDAVCAHLVGTIDPHPEIAAGGSILNLGIAHGWAGILYAVLMWCDATGQPVPANIVNRLDQLADCAQRHRQGVRWPWTLGSAADDASNYMVGWCGGDAGFVHLWTLAARLTRISRHTDLAERSAVNSLHEDVALGDLCCGNAGRAYGLLALYKMTGDGRLLRRAQSLADAAACDSARWLHYPQSLYKGLIGVAALSADLEAPERSAMPFFESERWPVFQV